MDTSPSEACGPARAQGLDEALPNRAQDRFDKESFKQIFRDHWNDFTAAHPRYDTPYYDRVIAKMLNCGDPATMGFAQYRCFSCGEARKIAFSCKSCFCLSCAKVYADHWVEFIGRRLFPGVVYRHIVLTVPDYLRLWFYRQPELLSPLMRAGHACLREVFRTCSHGDLDIGSVIVLQTNGRPGNYNPHLHILVPAGGLDPQGRWQTIRFIPFDLLHRTWQYHLLTMLREQIDDPHIEPEIDHGFTHYPKGFVANVQPGDVPPGGTGRGWPNTWPNTSSRRPSPCTGSSATMDTPSPTGTATIAPRRSNTRRSRSSGSSDAWCNTSCPKASTGSATTDYTVIGSTTRCATSSPPGRGPTAARIHAATASSRESRSPSASPRRSAQTPGAARCAATPWTWR